MKLTDTRKIDAPVETVWAAILDPEVLKACIPGCDSLTGSVAEGYEATVRQKVGPVSATFTGLVQISDMVPGSALRITGEGKGGVAGFARGAAQVTFTPQERATLLTYEVEASVGGKIAQLGSRIIDSFARKLADDFFARFQDAVEDPAAAQDGAPEDQADADAAETEGAAKKGWFKRLIGA